MPKAPPLTLFRYRWSHHGGESGFDALATSIADASSNTVTSILVTGSQQRSIIQRVVERLWRPAPLSDSVSAPLFACVVSPKNHEAAKKAVALLKKDPKLVLVLLAGESQFSHVFAEAEPAVLSRIVIILHQPPSWMRLHGRDVSLLDRLRGVVCLSESHATWLRRVTKAPVFVMKHGVRHDFFVPRSDGGASDGKRLLFVGVWLRDVETLEKTMALIWERHPSTTLDCVTPFEFRTHPSHLRMSLDDRIRWHAGLSGEALRSLYQQSDVMVMPLIDGTANNAVNEALACGLPIVSTRIGGSVDYVPEGAGELCPPGDAGAHAEATIAFMESRDRRERAGQIGRRFAVDHLDWGAIAREFLGAVTDGPLSGSP